MLLLLPEDHQNLITMAEAIEAVAESFRQMAENRSWNAPRRRIHSPANVRVGVHQGAMPSMGMTGLMTHTEKVGIFKEIQRYLHRAAPVHILFDAESGHLEGIIVGELSCQEVEADAIVALRTAANSAVGTQCLARPDSQTLGLFGSGGQARNHLVAFCQVRPLQRVQVYSRSAEHRKAFCEAMQPKVEAELIPVNSPEEAVRGADIVLTATNSNVAVFSGDWLEEGSHVTSIVASNVGLVRAGFISERRRELDDRTIQRAQVVAANSREQAQQDEQGDLWIPVQKGLLEWEEVVELSDLLAGRHPGRQSPSQITVFKNNGGQGITDVALASAVFQKASALGRGLVLDIS